MMLNEAIQINFIAAIENVTKKIEFSDKMRFGCDKIGLYSSLELHSL
jgi:hypothetical protein